MKYLIIGNKDTNKLALELSDYYGIEIFNVSSSDNINEINKIVRENKEWIIEGEFIDNLDVLCNLCETVIYLDYSKKKDNDNTDLIKLLQKHIRKGIIIRSKREYKKYLKSVYESDRYNF